MTWQQVCPGVWEAVAITAEDALAKLSNIPVAAIGTHRLETWQHRNDGLWWPTVLDYAGSVYKHPFMTLLGATGTGKTHIAFAIGWAWLAQDKSVLCYQVEGLLDTLRHGYSCPEGQDYDSIMQSTQTASLLILDDLGAQYDSKWSIPKLEQIVDYRYIHQKPLIVTTNIALNRLPARIADRLTEGTLVQLTGESFRKQRKASGSGR